jgi:hypothetical protein
MGTIPAIDQEKAGEIERMRKSVQEKESFMRATANRPMIMLNEAIDQRIPSAWAPRAMGQNRKSSDRDAQRHLF